MKYYSEVEVNRVLRPIVDSYVLDHALQRMVPTFLPTFESTSSDRERIRMELWKDLFVSRPFDTMIGKALEAFDKQFPNS